MSNAPTNKFPFIMTTTPDTTEFSFVISAAGKFVIDWGDGNIEKIDNYKLPTDKELAEQAVNDIICETCYLAEQCNRISCLRPKKELGQLKREMTKMVMGGKKK